MNASMETLNYTMQRNAQNMKSGAAAAYMKDMKDTQKAMRAMTNADISARGGYLTETVKITSATTAFNDRLMKQKVHLKDIYKNLDVVKGAFKEQIALQNMYMATYERSASGKMMADVYVPAQSLKSMKTMRQELGYMGNLLSSASLQAQNWGKNTQWAGRQLMVGFTVPTVIAAAAVAKFGYEADKAMTKIVKVYDNGADGITLSTDQIRNNAMQSAKSMAAMYGTAMDDTLNVQAELAAAGKTGIDLQRQTAQVSKAMVLGELERAAAISTSISLQDAFNLSVEESNEKWNLFNSIENATSLSMKDITDSLPRVGGIMNALGGSVEDTTVLLTAFKAAGIDAVEGATALKSISFKMLSPSGKARDTFKALTGMDYDDILKKTKGEIIPTLLELGKTMEGLTKLQKVDLVSDLIGIHQGSKFFGLVEQMANLEDETTQVGRAFKVTNQDSAAWAETARGEIEKLRASVSNRFQRALRTAQAEMAELGIKVLDFIMPLIEMGGRLLEGVNNLSDSKKAIFLWGAAIVGAIGVVTMFTGLLLNLIGMFGRTVGGVLKLIAPMKILNTESAAAALQAKMAAHGFDVETNALTQMERAMRDVVTMQVAMQRHASMPGFQMVNGVLMKPTGQADATGTPIMGRASKAEFNRWNNIDVVSRDVEGLSEKTKKNWGMIAGSTAAAAGSVAMMGSMMSEEGSKKQSIFDAASMAAFVSMALPLGSIGDKIKTSWAGAGKSVAATSKVATVARSAVGGLAGAGRALSMVAFGPIGLAAAGALGLVTLAVMKHKKALEEQEKQYAATRDSAKQWADVLGFEYTQQAKVAGRTSTTASESQDRLDMNKKIAALKKANEELYGNLQKLQGADQAQQLDAAIDEAMKVRLHGGTVDAALEAARIAMATMKNYMSKADLKVLIKGVVDLEDPSKSIDRYANKLTGQMNAAINDKFEGRDDIWESLSRMGSDNGINSTARQEIKSGVTAWYEAVNTADDEVRSEAIKRQNEKFSKDLWAGYKKALTIDPNNPVLKDYQSFVKAIIEGTYAGSKTTKGLGQTGPLIDPTQTGLKAQTTSTVNLSQKTQELMNGLRGAATANKEFIDSTANQAGILKDVYGNVYDLTALYPDLGVKVVNLQQAEANELQQEKAWNREQARLKAALAATGGKVKEATMTWAEFDEVMKDTTVTSTDVVSSIQGSMSKTMDTVFQAAEDMMDQRYEAATSALQAKGQADLDALDVRADVSRAKQEQKEKALSRRLEAADKSLQKSQEARRKKIEASYDARIKKIDDAIEAEKKAEDIRQRIFEAEKSRIERMATLYSKNIDMGGALSTGNFDEAAKISNDITATTEGWNVDDASDSSKSASEQRIAGLEAQKETIEKAKNARLDALKTVDDREKEALDRSKDRQQEQLKAETDRINKSLEAEKKSITAKNKANEDALRRRQEMERIARNQELATLKEFIPANEAELKQHIARVEKAYGLHGGDLTRKGTQWGKIVGDALSSNVSAAAENLRNKVRWADIGKDAAEKMIKASMGLNLAQFQKYLTTGDYDAAMSMKSTPMSRSTSSGNKPSMHTGGIVGRSLGGRTGFSGSQSQSEMTINALKGEGILNRKATRMVGMDFIDELNAGRLPAMGGPDLLMGPAGVIGSMIAAMTKSAMKTSIDGMAGIGPGGSGVISTTAGKYGGTNFDAAQLKNASIIATVGQQVGATNRDILIALMTAMQESMLRNLHYGDRDSLGLFQQRAAWGSVADRTNPTAAARMFFLGGKQGQRGLLDFPDRNKLGLAQAAQAVQVSAFPDAYAKWEDEARAIFGSRTGGRIGDWIRPADGPVTSKFGYRIHPITGERKLHAGSDIGAPGGAPIRAARAGVVDFAGSVSGYGNYTIIEHADGTKTAYAHQASIGVKKGQMVMGGQQIGRVGTTGASTGNHLHFEYLKNGVRVNPNTIIPGLLTGASLLRGGLANLHKGETVLPKPLSKDLRDGIQNLDNNAGPRYNVEKIEIVVQGPVTEATGRTLKNAVKGALRELENEAGPKRKVGSP